MGNDPQDICRLCAGTFLSVVPIFGNDDLPVKIQNISSLEVKLNDGLPAQVCHQCAQLINLFYHFKLRCESSDYFFRQTHGLSSYDAEDQMDEYMHEDCVDNTAGKVMKTMESMERNLTVNELQANSQNENEEMLNSELAANDSLELSEANGRKYSKMKSAIPGVILEPYMRPRPGKKPHFPVNTLAKLLEEHKEIMLTSEGQIQPKAAPVWKYLCELLNDKLQGTYSTNSNNVYTYVKCNRYNLQSYLGIDTDRRRKGQIGKTESITNSNSVMKEVLSASKDTCETFEDDSQTKSNEHDYHIPEETEKGKIKFVINLSEEEWLDMAPESEDGESLLSRQGWSRINRYFRIATQTQCRMTYTSGCVTETDRVDSYFKMYGKCQFCSSIFIGHVNNEDLLPGEPIEVHCTYVGAFNQPHPRIAQQREIFKQEADI